MPNPYGGLSIPLDQPSAIKRRYSVTSDVVAFRRCGRQYGAFRVHNYAPAYQTQLYFGTIIHQVLDRCHSHYNGIIDPNTRGQVPDNGQILSNREMEQYFDTLRDAEQNDAPLPPPPTALFGFFLEVENGLKSRGINAITPDLRVKALQILQYFNRLEGPVLYPRVVDTEYRLQADQQTHILHGVVDLLVGSPGGSTDPGQCEIWDYKGTSALRLTPNDLETYRFQMRVYGRLYELKNGVRPNKALLYFMNELEGDTCPTTRPANAVLEVPLEPSEVDIAVNEFAATVREIELARQNDQWTPAPPGRVSEQDCAICDLRWDCPTPNNGRGVEMRYP